jgi:sugar/nucleoside kinase (ribokinase family)
MVGSLREVGGIVMSQHNTICCIGSANMEQIISIQQSLELGAKNDTREHKVSAGGSALNGTCRLLAMGFDVLPIVPVGDDEEGQKVLEVFRTSLAKGSSRITLGLDELVQKGSSTSSSVVVIDPLGRRTIISWTGTASERFEPRLLHCLDHLESPPEAVIVGHISADKYGSITRRAINWFSERGTYVLVNMGRTQYQQGPGAFLEVLGKVDCLQFELAEAKSFVASHFKSEVPPLEGVLKWLIDYARPRSVVLTLAEAGAVACHRDAADEVLLAWPYDLEGIIRDSTGAGDAFAAGLASAMAGSDRGLNQFENALAIARDWAAYACTTLGGAFGCPDHKELQAFIKQNQDRVLRAPERRSWETARHILRYFDIARRYSLLGFPSSA